MNNSVVWRILPNAVFVAISNRTHSAVNHLDLGVIPHLTHLTATIHVARHFGTFVKVDLGKHGRGEFVVGKQGVCFEIEDTTAGAEHAAAIPAGYWVINFVVVGGYHHILIADGAADVDLRKRIGSVRNGCLTHGRRTD